MAKRKRSRAAAPGLPPAARAKPAAPAPTGPAASAPAVAARREKRSQSREERERAYTRQRRKKAAIRWGVAAAVVLGLSALVLSAAGFGLPEYGRAAPYEGGVGAHISPGAPLTQRNRPPSSGPHYGSRAAYSVTREPAPPGEWLHALEHGGIVVLYRCVDQAACDATATELERTVYSPARAGRFGERKLVVTPYPDLPSPFAVLAWGRILELDTLDSAQMLAFYDRYVDRGPENAA